IEDEVKLLGYLAENEMLKLFHAATLKVFPSLYEGFGLPVLEAMASGLPVVAGNNSSIPEVAGSAALLLPDAKVEIWAKEIINLLSNRDQREKFSLLGVEQAKKFTWQATAEKTLKAYQYFMR
ncbi:MAG: glycosyltransferase, partial [Proteobacteria bacterium]|nr:glycosyltransferase [Pseudomonadota bacterium]